MQTDVPEEPHHELAISDFGVDGDGVGRLADGLVVFVPGALPGDRVRIRLCAGRDKVRRAELVELLEPSVDRVPSRCQVVACGGCALRELSSSGQAKLKRSHVVETLRRLGRIDVSGLLDEVTQWGDGWRTRHRVRLHAAFRGGRYELGFHERRSHALVPLSTCPVLWPELEAACIELGSALSDLSPEARLSEVEVVYSRRDARAAAKLSGQGPLGPYKDWLRRRGLELRLEIRTPSGSLRRGPLELRYDHGRAGDYELRFEPGVFTQAHPELNDRLVEAVLSWIRPAEHPRVLELHAGIGNFSLPLSLAGARVTATEQSARASELCRRNALAAGADIEVRALADTAAVRELERVDTVLLDPPRAGARRACERIVGAPSVRRIVYVSCDVATLARDAALLVRGGFRVTAARAFDLFPETPHVETVLALAR